MLNLQSVSHWRTGQIFGRNWTTSSLATQPGLEICTCLVFPDPHILHKYSWCYRKQLGSAAEEESHCSLLLVINSGHSSFQSVTFLHTPPKLVKCLEGRFWFLVTLRFMNLVGKRRGRGGESRYRGVTDNRLQILFSAKCSIYLRWALKCCSVSTFINTCWIEQATSEGSLAG